MRTAALNLPTSGANIYAGTSPYMQPVAEVGSTDALLPSQRGERDRRYLLFAFNTYLNTEGRSSPGQTECDAGA